jgi:hypothetical protein
MEQHTYLMEQRTQKERLLHTKGQVPHTTPLHRIIFLPMAPAAAAAAAAPIMPCLCGANLSPSLNIPTIPAGTGAAAAATATAAAAADTVGLRG